MGWGIYILFAFVGRMVV
ncbi:hypothetical protein LJE04_04440 [Dorea formicigenerans]|uniref:Uncharacterized protein n=1 Tax=Dorea formicigenerans TaxID=39486 RepID=A0A3E5ESV9_9FIRM|nr:hypothetical protein [Dorea sp. 210702-DFI.3.125]MCB8574605.1 hypothetical protein [Dorea formicigenerans]NSE61408.1 hypothetical protein [Dorea formicigenerans]NSE87149.1 hypothetical protein [Dorea formicigenerans]RGJ63402.1 hypothetical protein DXD50_12055 [Dorea formicigenerans]